MFCDAIMFKMVVKHRKRSGWAKKMKSILLYLVSLGLIVTGVFIVWASSIDLPDLSSFNERRVSESTKIYDRTGEHLLYEIFGEENRTLVKLQEGFCEGNDIELDENGIPLLSVTDKLGRTVEVDSNNYVLNPGFETTYTDGVLKGGLWRWRDGSATVEETAGLGGSAALRDPDGSDGLCTDRKPMIYRCYRQFQYYPAT